MAQSIDALLVAPATADVIAKFAHGVANDFLTTLFLATTAPVVIAPAMNVNMWEHPATQANLKFCRAAACACRARQRLSGLRHGGRRPAGGQETIVGRARDARGEAGPGG